MICASGGIFEFSTLHRDAEGDRGDGLRHRLHRVHVAVAVVRVEFGAEVIVRAVQIVIQRAGLFGAVAIDFVVVALIGALDRLFAAADHEKAVGEAVLSGGEIGVERGQSSAIESDRAWFGGWPAARWQRLGVSDARERKTLTQRRPRAARE